MNHRVRWHLRALASVVALLASLASLDAQALALGRVTVQSALGEPLRAEIDIDEITTDEAASLRAGVANADAFKAAGLEYTPAVIGVQVSLEKRPDGRSYLRLSSSRPVVEPFVDLVLEASWSSGRIVRDYTMLFDPPILRSGSAGGAEPITAPVLPRQAPADSPPARDIAAVPDYPTSPQPADAAAVAPTPAPVSAPASAGEKQVAVKYGDTAGKIVVQNKPASVSLDQMLVALLRNNPDAFMGGNVNRLKAGSVLEIPAANDAAAISPADASQIIIAQSTDFNDFRRKLAEGVPSTQADSASRQATGKVQAKVEDRAAPAAAPDKLTLSKGAVQSKAASIRVAELNKKIAELNKNIAELNNLTGSPAASSVTSVVTAAPGVTPTAPTVATLSPTVAPPPPPEPSLIDELMDNPYVLPGAAGLLLLLGAFGFYRYKNKPNDAAQVDSSFLESRLQPDSFFGASGGQRIDTSEQPHASTKATEESAQDQAAAAFGLSTIPQMRTAHPEVAAAAIDFDLDLDFSIGDEFAMTTASVPAPPVATTAQATALPPVPPAAPVVAALDSGMLEFDLSSLSLDLGGPTTASPSLAASGTSALLVSGDPLETKFALAEEFRTLGDTDGARSLAEEVVAQAKGPLKAKAQSFLASLS